MMTGVRSGKQTLGGRTSESNGGATAEWPARPPEREDCWHGFIHVVRVLHIFQVLFHKIAVFGVVAKTGLDVYAQ